jgi:hypothetical protein
MSIWGIVVVVGLAIFVAVAWFARGGKADRAARQELRQLRKAEKRIVNASAVRDRRKAMMIDPMPGRDTTPGGV